MSDTSASARAMEKEIKADSKKERAAPSKKGASAQPSFNMQELRDLADLVNEHGFTDFEFENQNIRVRLSKATAAPVYQTPQSHSAPAASTLSSLIDAEPPLPKPLVAPEEELFKITSPIVGTFYRSPGPDKEPYVSEGNKVNPETIVCIVEAMKLMNEIQAETSGEIVKIYVENGQPVEYGQPLFGIRK